MRSKGLYYVEADCGCTIVLARGKRSVRKWALRYFGEMNCNSLCVSLASDEEIDWNAAMGGITHEVTT